MSLLDIFSPVVFSSSSSSSSSSTGLHGAGGAGAGAGAGAGEGDPVSPLPHLLLPHDPTTQTPPTVPLLLARFISLSYLLLFLSTFSQLMRTVCYRHKILSFRFGFLSICFLWTFLRVLFWFFVNLHTWPVWLSTTVYFLPSACQMATFSLLILFFAKLVHRTRWRSLRSFFFTLCAVANCTMLILTCLFAGLFDRLYRLADRRVTTVDEAGDTSQLLNKIFYVCSSFFFGGLVICAAYYIRKLRMYRGSGVSKREIAMTSLIFLIFLSRCVFDLLAALETASTSSIFRHHITETADGSAKLLEFSTFALVFLWEIIPTLLVVVFHRSIPATGLSLCESLCTRCGWDWSSWYCCVGCVPSCCCLGGYDRIRGGGGGSSQGFGGGGEEEDDDDDYGYGYDYDEDVWFDEGAAASSSIVGDIASVDPFGSVFHHHQDPALDNHYLSYQYPQYGVGNQVAWDIQQGPPAAAPSIAAHHQPPTSLMDTDPWMRNNARYDSYVDSSTIE